MASIQQIITKTGNNNLSETSSNSRDKTNFFTEKSNFHNTSALSANALAVMQFISNSENNSNNNRKRMTVRSAVDIITHGSQQNSSDHSICYDYLDDRRNEHSNEFKCMNQVQIDRRPPNNNDVVADVSSSQKCLVRKRLRNNHFLRRIINKTANNQCDAHAKTKDFSIDFLLN
ncbi:hypothetical protein HA402_010360 [Bradysia odoriphaga]|nr:hypothetical protein HA402_010360 [Bradysia odoriphaga]